jgi:hypothetical protein
MRRARCSLVFTVGGRMPRTDAVSSVLASSMSRITKTVRNASGRSSIARSSSVRQLRELVEKKVEQARSAYGQLMDAMAQATRAWSTAASTEMASGFKIVQERAIQFAKENAEAGFTLASELANAKDLQEVLRLQSNFAQIRMQSYAQQVQELGRLMAEATRRGEPKG